MERADVVVTGISGFIAKHLARALVEAGETVVGVGRREPGGLVLTDALRFEHGDITNSVQILSLLERVRPRTVYHLAAHSVLTGSSAAEMLRINVSGIVNVLEACHAAGVGACVVASSDKQYGALATPPYDDADSTAFQNGGVYELSKAQQDQTARLWAGLYESPAVRIARLVNVYGPGDTHWTRIIPGTIRRTVQGDPPRVTAGRAGEALREYISVADAVEALRVLAIDALERGNAPYQVPEGRLARVAFNVAGGTRLSARGVVETVQSILRAEFGIIGPAPVVQPAPEGVFEPGSQYSGINKIAALFASQEKTYAPRSLKDGLREAIPWYLDHLRAG